MDAYNPFMVYRIDVWTHCRSSTADPQSSTVRSQIQQIGIDPGETRVFRVFFIDTPASREEVQRIADELLADPVVEQTCVVDDVPPDASKCRIEVHLKPGVMDPVAASTEMAIRDMGLPVTQVRTGRAYLFSASLTPQQLQTIARQCLANPVVESVFYEPYLPRQFAHAHEHEFRLRHVPIRDLDDLQLQTLSRQGHLFLSLAEMQAIQNYFRQQGREPTDIELETLAQTWSEHCVHKTLKSAVHVLDESGKTLRTYTNLIKETIFASTQSLMRQRQDGFCLSVFKDNAGVIRFDDQDAVCFKVETHNRPSAIEPYGGSATGIGGCIRDVLGTGLGAKPVANTDVFCVAYPDRSLENVPLPRGVIHPKRILQQVVAGVRDYGNRMGIPTVNGAVYFDDRYVGNPLVFCGCVGLIPNDKITKKVHPGDAIVVIGGRTGRDGIHGATFSSAELTDKHQDEFSHAVQIGNAIEQKRMMDVLLQARDLGLYNALTDCGAGGLSSAVGEMGAEVGAWVQLEKVPLKYKGLKYDEIWISEAQERMVLSVPPQHVDPLLKLARSENVEATVIGTFGTEQRELILTYQGTEVGRMSMTFLHDGIPMPTRKAVIKTDDSSPCIPSSTQNPGQELLNKLKHPNIASKHWIIRQYDHEVQGGSVVKPLTGPRQTGPSDASVFRPKLGSDRGVILSCGLAPGIADPYLMSIAAIDEALRNAVCVGANLDRLAILDNFCWPGTHDEIAMGTLVRSCEACRDAALAYGVPFISGKDSLHNQFTDSETGRVIKIPNTLLISAIGTIEDVGRVVTMDFKAPSDRVLVIQATRAFDLPTLARVHRILSRLRDEGLFRAIHDVSDGGYLVSAAEMCIGSGIGLAIQSSTLQQVDPFEEKPGGYVVELTGSTEIEMIQQAFGDDARTLLLGTTQNEPELICLSGEEPTLRLSIDQMTRAWQSPLDW
ncbi:MAG: phosphoribosylformylglycinamidine synthase subunit PurL [Phycisphaerae bacterium]|jgi:phosphoribosylformylglycinamidine synthase|nr:MAG: phosphoribosylformylglycinamidine synthase subunit PurL [Phycisphaerae bacterium]